MHPYCPILVIGLRVEEKLNFSSLHVIILSGKNTCPHTSPYVTIKCQSSSALLLTNGRPRDSSWYNGSPVSIQKRIVSLNPVNNRSISLDHFNY